MQNKKSTSEEYVTRILTDIHDVNPINWDACATENNSEINPFIKHSFLSALEGSGSVSIENGFQPQHILIQNKIGELLACAPLYLKNHSYGEYVFDWNWAKAYENAGGEYYPKLFCGIPFTPVTGPRLLVKKNLGSHKKKEIKKILLSIMINIVEKFDLSSLHMIFPNKSDFEIASKAGFLNRYGQQYHWKNNNYKNFNSFLNELSSRKRKNIKRERNIANNSEIEIKIIEGNDIKNYNWNEFYKLYTLTTDRKWGTAYLNRSFFDLISDSMAKNIVLILGYNNDNLLCGALNFVGNKTLFGRNWVTGSSYPMMHFEICYYRAIEYAINNQLEWVEAGAQGQHKLQRGYLPIKTYSSHWIRNENFRNAIRLYLKDEKRVIDSGINELSKLSPFKLNS